MDVSDKHAATYHGSETHTCEMCGDTYPSMRAAYLCEDRDIADAKDARRPVRHIMRPAAQWDDE